MACLLDYQVLAYEIKQTTTKKKVFMKKLSILLFLILISSACSNLEKPKFSTTSIAEKSGQQFTPKKMPDGVYHSKNQAVEVLNTGYGALAKRIEMIRSAKHTIEMEYFIFNLDKAGQMIIGEIIKATKRNKDLKVRILVDYSTPIFQVNKYIASALAEFGIEVRYYNTTPVINVWVAQYRNHRKIMIVDGSRAITGGRNIADEYFDMSPEYNFLDRDIYLENNLVSSMLETFDIYWDSPIVKKPAAVEKPVWEEVALLDMSVDPYINDRRMIEATEHYEKGITQASQFIDDAQTEKKILADILATEKQKHQNNAFTCPDAHFITNLPSKFRNDGVITEYLVNLAGHVDSRMIIESPYFIPRFTGSSVLSKLLKNNVEVNVLTNSLHSTDAIYAVAAFETRMTPWALAGLKASIYNGEYRSYRSDLPDDIKKARWGIHAKTAVIDRNTTIIGTYNFDPRSKSLNSENIFVCQNNPALAQNVEDDIQSRFDQSYELNKLGYTKNKLDRHFKASISTRIQYYLLLPLANVLDWLQ